MWSLVSFEQDKTLFEYIHLVKKYTVILGGWQIFVTSLYSKVLVVKSANIFVAKTDALK
jgi:hypothetical protein